MDAYNHVQKLDISWFENKKVGDITHIDVPSGTIDFKILSISRFQ